VLLAPLTRKGNFLQVKELKRMNLGRSFDSKDPKDRIWDVLHLPQEVATLEVCRAKEAQIQYFLTLAKCTFSSIPGQTFDDLFPREAILNYRDDKGKVLPQLQWTGSEPGRTMLRAPRDAVSHSCAATTSSHHLSFTDPARNKPGAMIMPASNITDYDHINQSTLYLVLEALPRFAYWLASAFSDCLHYERAEVAKSQAEAKAFVAQITQGFKEDPPSASNEPNPPHD